MKKTDEYYKFKEQIDNCKTVRTSVIARHPDYAELRDYVFKETQHLNHLKKVTITRRLWHFWNEKMEIPKCEQCKVQEVAWDIVNQDYRKLCSKKCTGAYNAAKAEANALLSNAPTCKNEGCSNSVTRKYRDKADGILKWRNCCSKKCSIQYRNSIRAPEDEVIAFISERGEYHDSYLSLNSQQPGIFNTIQDMTINCPTMWQINDRILWLLGKKKCKRDLVKEAAIVAGVDPSSVQTKTELYNTQVLERSSGCKQCGAPRVYKESTRRYRKFCDSVCEEEYTKRVQIKKLIRTIKKYKIPKSPPSNKNMDLRLNDREWLYNMHHNKKMKKSELATLFNVDKETITNRFKQFEIETVKWNKSVDEDMLYNHISSIYPGEIIRNSRQIIPPKELDIYIPDLNIAIEYCGLYWHCTKHDRITPSYHKHKMDQCLERGIQLITIFEDEWLHKNDIVKNKLSAILGCSSTQKINGRDTICKYIDTQTRREFLNNTHIQGDSNGSVNIGLYHTDELVSCMTLYKQQGNWILNRYASKYNVRGGFSKMISHFRKIHNDPIVTFADLRWSMGNLYNQTGFKYLYTTSVDYYYVDSINKKRIHKFNFRHKNLPNILEHYDPNLSETVNCANNGWYRIYNCGLKKYVLE